MVLMWLKILVEVSASLMGYMLIIIMVVWLMVGSIIVLIV